MSGLLSGTIISPSCKNCTFSLAVNLLAEIAVVFISIKNNLPETIVQYNLCSERLFNTFYFILAKTLSVIEVNSFAISSLIWSPPLLAILATDISVGSSPSNSMLLI